MRAYQAAVVGLALCCFWEDCDLCCETCASITMVSNSCAHRCCRSCLARCFISNNFLCSSLSLLFMIRNGCKKTHTIQQQLCVSVASSQDMRTP